MGKADLITVKVNSEENVSLTFCMTDFCLQLRKKQLLKRRKFLKNPNNYTESQYKTAKSIYNKHCTELNVLITIS